MTFTEKKARIVSVCAAALLLVSGAIIGLNGFSLGLDFTGGIIMEISDTPQNYTSLKAIFAKEDAVIKYISSEKVRVSIRNISIDSAQNAKRIAGYRDEIEAIQGRTVDSVDYIGSKFGKDAIKNSIYAVLAGMVAIYIYIWIKFGRNMAISSTIGLGYTIVSVLAIASILGFELNFMAVSAILTLIGYCINDTVVVFDKIRTFASESVGKKIDEKAIIDAALTAVLRRSIITSSVTCLAIIPLAFFIYQDMRIFAILVISGIVIGTVVSILTAPVMHFCNLKLNVKLPKQPQVEDPMKYV